jgi:putative aldouronate transport system permease protein
MSDARAPAADVAAVSPLRRRRRVRNPRRLAKLYLFVLPAALLLLLFAYVPIYGIVIAFKDYSPYLGIFGTPWIGLKHFRAFLSDPKFWNVIKNTLVISALDIGFGFPAPIIFALLANEIVSRRFKRVMQTISYLPHFISWVVVFGIFYQFLSPVYGVAMRFVAALGIDPPNLLGRVSLFRPLVVSAEIWKGVGWGSILYFATIAGIDEGLYEAAYIDGAGRLRMAFSITIPGILPIVMLLLIFRIASFFSVGFERIFVFSNALNYSVSDTLAVYVYRMGLVETQYSRTAAIGLTQSVLAFALLFTANRVSGRVAGLSLW